MGITGKPITAGGGKSKVDVLWENPNYTATSTMGAETLTGQNLEGIQDFPIVLVKARVLNTTPTYFSLVPVFQEQQENVFMELQSTTGANGSRLCSVQTDAMDFSNGRLYASSSNNTVLVPKTIYGVK